MIVPPDETAPVMDRSAKAVISDLLARDVTAVLKRHGFAGRGRNYRRVLADRQELLTVEPHRWNTRHGGAFTINLGVFLDELDAFVSPAPPPEPPDEHECHLRCRAGDVGPDGSPLDHAGDDPRRGWWGFDATTDLTALGAEVRTWLQGHAFGCFERLRTDAGLLAWVRRYRRPGGRPGLRHVYLAAAGGDPALAQEWLDGIVATAPDPGPIRREAARFAARLGIACPAPTDSPTLTVLFRLAADAPPRDREDAVRHLAYKLDQHLIELRAGRAEQDAARLYHTVTRDGLTCTADFYGAGAEDLLRPLRRAFAKLSAQFAEITWQAR